MSSKNLKNSFDLERLIKEIVFEGLDKVYKHGKSWLKRRELENLLKKDFERLVLPEEIKLDLLKKERVYPLLISSPYDIPTKLDRRIIPLFAFDSKDVSFPEKIRAIYHIATLIDNFFPEAKALLPLEANLGLILAEAEIRAFRNGEEGLVNLYRGFIGEEARDSLTFNAVRNYFGGEDGMNFDKIIEWRNKFYLLFEAGLFFSVVIPKMKDIYYHFKRPTEDNKKDFIQFIDRLCEIENGIRNDKLDKELLILNNKTVGRVGFVPVKEEIGTVASFIEEKFTKNCDEVIVFSRGLVNNMTCMEGIVIASTNLNLRGFSIGIKESFIDESFRPESRKWITGLRVWLCKEYLKNWEKKINELKAKKITFYIEEYETRLGAKLNEIDKIKKILGKKGKICITNHQDGFRAGCIIELIRTLKGSIHFVEDIVFFMEEKEEHPYLKVLANLEIIK